MGITGETGKTSESIMEDKISLYLSYPRVGQSYGCEEERLKRSSSLKGNYILYIHIRILVLSLKIIYYIGIHLNIGMHVSVIYKIFP